MARGCEGDERNEERRRCAAAGRRQDRRVRGAPGRPPVTATRTLPMIRFQASRPWARVRRRDRVPARQPRNLSGIVAALHQPVGLDGDMGPSHLKHGAILIDGVPSWARLSVLSSPANTGQQIRRLVVLSWNVHVGGARMEQLVDLISATNPRAGWRDRDCLAATGGVSRRPRRR